jgi:hypothetical protein
MNRALLVGGGLVAAGVAFAYVRKIGPFAPPETQIDPNQKIVGGEGLSPEDLKALGAPPPAPPSSGEGGDLYRIGIADYIKRAWTPGGAGVRSSLPVALVKGDRGVTNVTGGGILAKTSSASLLSNYAGATENAAGWKLQASTARGFKLNEYQAAIYAPDAGRLWGLVEGYVDTPSGTRIVDVFVTGHANQPIDAVGSVYGAGLVFAWDNVVGAWVEPSKLKFRGNPARQIYRDGKPWIQTATVSEWDRVKDFIGSGVQFKRVGGSSRFEAVEVNVFGYRDVEGERIREDQLIRLANESRTKAKPV